MGQVIEQDRSRVAVDRRQRDGDGELSPGVLFMPTFPKDVRPFDTGSGSAIAGDGTRSEPPNS